MSSQQKHARDIPCANMGFLIGRTILLLALLFSCDVSYSQQQTPQRANPVEEEQVTRANPEQAAKAIPNPTPEFKTITQSIITEAGHPVNACQAENSEKKPDENWWNKIWTDPVARSSASGRCLFVCTFGFGLSASANDYGNQLAGVVEHGNACVLNRSHGAAPSLQAILNHPNIQFWGDLDTAGMQIFCRLVTKIPQLALSALYHPMVEAIEIDTRRHPYVDAVGKAGQSRMAVQTTRDNIRTLLHLCEKFAVDQEVVSSEEIVKLAGRALETWTAR